MKRINKAIILTISGLLLLMVAILSFAYLTAPTEAPVQSQVVTQTVEPPTVEEILRLVNIERSKVGVSPLVSDERLNQAASKKAQHMIENDYWSHTAPDGTIPWSFVQSTGYAYRFVGENLAKDYTTSEGVVEGWMNSEGHRANALHIRFNEVGHAVIKGNFQGTETIIVVAFYAQSY